MKERESYRLTTHINVTVIQHKSLTKRNNCVLTWNLVPVVRLFSKHFRFIRSNLDFFRFEITQKWSITITEHKSQWKTSEMRSAHHPKPFCHWVSHSEEYKNSYGHPTWCYVATSLLLRQMERPKNAECEWHGSWKEQKESHKKGKQTSKYYK